MTADPGFDAFFRRHHDAVLRYALRRVDRPDAGDVVSEVFLVAWRRRAPEVVPDLPWLLGVARKVVANHRRSDTRTRSLYLRVAHEPAHGPTDLAERVAVADQWSRALARLSVDDQELLGLVAWDGLSTTEAARALGCSAGTVSMRLTRARRRLREHLRRAEDGTAASLVTGTR